MAHVSITVPVAYGATKASLLQALNRPEIPDTARISVSHIPRDRPFDSEQYNLVVTFNI